MPAQPDSETTRVAAILHRYLVAVYGGSEIDLDASQAIWRPAETDAPLCRALSALAVGAGADSGSELRGPTW